MHFDPSYWVYEAIIEKKTELKEGDSSCQTHKQEALSRGYAKGKATQTQKQ